MSAQKTINVLFQLVQNLKNHKFVILALPLLGGKIFYLVRKTKPAQILYNTNNNQETIENFLRHLMLFDSFPHNSTLYSLENQISFITTFLCQILVMEDT